MEWCVKYHDILDSVITALDSIHRNGIVLILIEFSTLVLSEAVNEKLQCS